MTTEFTFDADKLKRLRKKLGNVGDKVFNRKALLFAATRQKQRMLMRTENGKDLNGNAFKPYNAIYALKKGKLNINKVNLTDQAEMLNSITQNSTDKEAHIFFNNVVRDGKSTEQIANYHNTLGAGRSRVIRKFFGIGETEGQKIFKDYTNGIRRDLEREGFK